jgi:hypothetical protein
MNIELGTIWKQAIVAFKALSQNFHGPTMENYEEVGCIPVEIRTGHHSNRNQKLCRLKQLAWLLAVT